METLSNSSILNIQRVIDCKGHRVIGKGCWKDCEVGKFNVGNSFPSS